MNMYATCRAAIAAMLCITQLVAHAQPDTTQLYHVNYKWKLPVSVAFLGASYYGFRVLDENASFTAEDVKYLDPKNINTFDRPVAYYNPARFESAHNTSDMILNIAVASPVLLLADGQVRRNWKPYISMFLMAHAVDNAIYFGTVAAVRRARPLTYNPNLTVEQKTGTAKSNSFFSGHVSFSATSTFYMAKVYTDYHHIRGWKRLLIFTGAAIPPSLVGYYRMQAGRHFRTDVITGLVVGAATGIVVPQLHKQHRKHNALTVSPFYMPSYSGLTLTYHIR